MGVLSFWCEHLFDLRKGTDSAEGASQQRGICKNFKVPPSLSLPPSLALSLAEEIRPEGCESGSIRFSEEKEKDCSSSTLVRPDRRCQIISEADLLLLLHLIE